MDIAPGELDARERARREGYLAQAGHSAWALAVEDIVAMGRLPRGDTDAIATALRATGANALVGRRIDTLAGGDQAPAPTGQPQLLLADEPVASVDLYSQLTMMGTLRSFPLTDMLQLNPFRIICSE